jgi:hypothetical protein
VINESERILRLNLRYYHEICLEGLRKTTKTSVRLAGRASNLKENLYILCWMALILWIWQQIRRDTCETYCSVLIETTRTSHDTILSSDSHTEGVNPTCYLIWWTLCISITLCNKTVIASNETFGAHV